LVLTALALYDLPVEEADVAVLTRLAAALREIGFSVLALPIAHAFYARTPGYFEAFELAKALRASGSYVDALAIVDAERARQRMEPNSAQNIAALGDEFVKSAIRVPARSAEIPRVLAESAATYRAANLPVYAERCERWGDNLSSPILAEGGLAEDEWRASIRAEQLSTIEKEQAYALGQRAFARVLLLTRSG